MRAASLVVAALAGVTVLSFGLMVLGLLRLPDAYARAHATSKADTLGTLAALGAAAVAFGAVETTAKLVVLLLFLLTTGPTAAHAITRAARIEGYEPVGGDVPEDDGGEDGT